jgi:hypothetical protein
MQSTLPNPEILDSIDSLYFVRCSSKKEEKGEKHKTCSRKAEAKKDHRIECGVPGH